jgi:hypothetical protein
VRFIEPPALEDYRLSTTKYCLNNLMIGIMARQMGLQTYGAHGGETEGERSVSTTRSSVLFKIAGQIGEYFRHGRIAR